MKLKPLSCYMKIANVDCVFNHAFTYLTLPVIANDFEEREKEEQSYFKHHENEDLESETDTDIPIKDIDVESETMSDTENQDLHDIEKTSKTFDIETSGEEVFIRTNTTDIIFPLQFK